MVKIFASTCVVSLVAVVGAFSGEVRNVASSLVYDMTCEGVVRFALVRAMR